MKSNKSTIELATLGREKNPQVEQIRGDFLEFNEKGEICGACYLSFVFLGLCEETSENAIYRLEDIKEYTKASVPELNLNIRGTNFGLDLGEMIIMWNDNGDSINQIEERIEDWLERAAKEQNDG